LQSSVLPSCEGGGLAKEGLYLSPVSRERERLLGRRIACVPSTIYGNYLEIISKSKLSNQSKLFSYLRHPALYNNNDTNNNNNINNDINNNINNNSYVFEYSS
jgi:hypothetical protein